MAGGCVTSGSQAKGPDGDTSQLLGYFLAAVYWQTVLRGLFLCSWYYHVHTSSRSKHLSHLPTAKKKKSSFAKKKKKKKTCLQYFQSGCVCEVCAHADIEAIKTVWLAGSLDHSKTSENVLQVEMIHSGFCPSCYFNCCFSCLKTRKQKP